MLISALRNHKTSSGISDFYVNDLEKGEVKVDTMYQIFYSFQRMDRDLTKLKQQR